MHIHILGICGTFMGSLAQLAVERGFKVTGTDQNVYPPMSDQLSAAGIELMEGFDHELSAIGADLWVVGNAMSRGNTMIEAILNTGVAYTSGPEFLKTYLLQDKWVLAVAGTHGKTSTSSMLAWILEYAGFEPGFLIGGVPTNFDVSARMGCSDFFVIEADEYDTAFFDKRSKFIHYKARTLILNNLEFDHADIFDDLEAIKRQFHHLLRTIPFEGQVICNQMDEHLQAVLDMGCWTPVQYFSADKYYDATGNIERSDNDWQISDGGDIKQGPRYCGTLHWPQLGTHNQLNALGVVAAAKSIGIAPELSIEALGHFNGIQRRMEVIYQDENCTVYDDFAHHPTAIEATLSGLRKAKPNARIVAVVELRSNTMKMGVHGDALLDSTLKADKTYWFQVDASKWSLSEEIGSKKDHSCFERIEPLLAALQLEKYQGGEIVIMSNGGFGGLHQKLIV